MTTDNRTNEPTEAQVEAAAKTMHETRNPWFEAYGDWGAAGFEIKQAFRESARAALVAAQGATTEELAKIKPLFENLSREYPNECNKRVKAEAERDAALAAIERVRAVLVEERAWHEHLVESGDAMPRNVIGIGKVEAALDGAPEPEEVEWEYGCAWDDGETQMAFPVEAAEAHLRKFPEPNGRLVRRRPAGPWEACNG